MVDFDQIGFNTTAFSLLTTISQTGRIPNAFIFIGENGTRKHEAALYFAKCVNCLESRERPCGICRSCKKVAAGLHPDLVTIGLEKGKKAIAISQIRDLGSVLSAKPNEARVRLALIREADRMNTQAQNALLKLLEEPPENTVFVLLASKASWLLATIRSRCRAVRFKSLTRDNIQTILIRHYDADPVQASIAAETAEYDLEKSLAFLNQGPDDDGRKKADWVQIRQELLPELAGLLDRPDPGTQEPPGQVARALSLSLKLSRAPDMLPDVLSMIRLFLRDLLLLGVDSALVVNQDFSARMQQIHRQAKPEALFGWMEALFETEQRLLSNSSPRLTLDRFFLKLALNPENAAR